MVDNREIVKALKVLTDVDTGIWGNMNWGNGNHSSVIQRYIFHQLEVDDIKEIIDYIPDFYAKTLAKNMFEEDAFHFKEYAERFDFICKDREYLEWAWENESETRKMKIFDEFVNTGILTKQFVEDNEDFIIQWLNEYGNGRYYYSWQYPSYEKVLRKFKSKRLAVAVLMIDDMRIKQKAREFLSASSVKVCHHCDANMRKSTIKYPCNYCGRPTHRACIRKEYIYNKFRSKKRWDSGLQKWVPINPNQNNNPDYDVLKEQYCLCCKYKFENNIKIEG